MPKIRARKIRGTDYYVISGGPKGISKVLVAGKERRNQVVAARRRLVIKRRLRRRIRRLQPRRK